MINPAEINAFVNKLVDSSGDNIRKHFRNLDKIDTKKDESPVTIADREAEKLMRDMINAEYPDHGIQGEEFGIENANAEYKWIIDPIDGTLSFMIGRPTFGTLVGLMHNNKTIAGVIDQPISGERWFAYQGYGATLNNKKINTRPCKKLDDAILCTTGPNYFSNEKLNLFNKVSEKSRFTIYGGDCYMHGLLAAGHNDIIIESGLKPHDFLPIIPIITEAGGIATDWQGNPPNPDLTSDIIIAGDKRVHEQALEILR